MRLLTSFTRTLGLGASLWLIAGTLAVFAADRLLDVRHGLNAVYFAGAEWRSGAASVTGVDVLPSTDVLKRRRPDFAEHAFSVEWRGFIVVLRSGAYTFATVSDDGSWLYVRGKLVVENPGRHGPVEARGNITLPAGVHSIFIHYFQDGGDCAFQARWSRAGDALEPVPASALLTERVSYGRLVGRRVTDVALMLVAIAWCAAVGLAFAVWAYRATGRRMRVWRGGIDPALVSVLLLSVLLNVWGIWWALPNTRGWAPDELVPADVLDALGRLFSHGWYGKYPPFHYAVLSVADTPMLLLSWLGVVDLQTPGPYMGLFLIGRLVSVVFGAGTVMVVPVRPRTVRTARCRLRRADGGADGAVRLLREADQPRGSVPVLVRGVAAGLHSHSRAPRPKRLSAVRRERGARRLHQGPGVWPVRPDPAGDPCRALAPVEGTSAARSCTSFSTAQRCWRPALRSGSFWWPTTCCSTSAGSSRT